MEFTKAMFYVGKRSFKSKEGKAFNVVSFADYEPKSKSGSVCDLFIDEMPKLCDELHFLDLVECTLELTDMGSKPRLLAINKLLKRTIEEGNEAKAGK